ncbi:MAG: bifunctional phosphoribosylaminoimidazolecarboxamide formyltransferase/IMP cyclohydrolase [Candidatus Methylacidiphilales bacterium]
MKIRNALVSVSDKAGILSFAQFLAARGVNLISTGGTAKLLREAGVPVRDISEHTGFPEMMDGRVKTLHPKVHGGLLFIRGNPEHEAQAAAHGIEPIDLVIVNLYPFAEAIARPNCSREEAIENIDIGGPSMLRSAAKNHASVTVLVDPADYARVQAELEAQGETSPDTRRALAAKVFRHTAAYDARIAQYLTEADGGPSARLAESFTLAGDLVQPLRYGENPHQRAALYGEFPKHFRQLHGKELSFNNIIDIAAAAALIREFSDPTLAILKHTNPCGVATAPTLRAAWEAAFATDRQAPFGGIIVVNQTLDQAVAEAIAEIFSEVIVAPDFTPEALELLRKKKNLRLIENRSLFPVGRLDVRSVPGGFLVQEADDHPHQAEEWQVVTNRKPDAEELRSLAFAWRVVKHVKSNAIVYAGGTRTLGIGAGQMSRVDASRIAVWKAGEAGLDLKGSVIASDAFFPFADGIKAAAEAGATAAIQPGGSVRDAEVIEAADQAGMAMVFTGRRHFRH